MTDSVLDSMFETRDRCYCMKPRILGEAEFNCDECNRWVHLECLTTKIDGGKKFGFLCDYKFRCKTCTYTNEDLVLYPTGIARMAVTVLANLQWRHKYDPNKRNDTFYSLEEDVIPKILLWWNSLTSLNMKNDSTFLQESFSACLMENSHVFEAKIVQGKYLFKLLIKNVGNVRPNHELIQKIDRVDKSNLFFYLNTFERFSNFFTISNQKMITTVTKQTGAIISEFSNSTGQSQYRFGTGIELGYFCFRIQILSKGQRSSLLVGFTRSKALQYSTIGEDNQSFLFTIPVRFKINDGIETEISYKSIQPRKQFRVNDIYEYGIFLPINKPESSNSDEPESSNRVQKGSMIVLRKGGTNYTAFKDIPAGEYFPVIALRGNIKVRVNLGKTYYVLDIPTTSNEGSSTERAEPEVVEERGEPDVEQ